MQQALDKTRHGRKRRHAFRAKLVRLGDIHSSADTFEVAKRKRRHTVHVTTSSSRLSGSKRTARVKRDTGSGLGQIREHREMRRQVPSSRGSTESAKRCVISPVLGVKDTKTCTSVSLQRRQKVAATGLQRERVGLAYDGETRASPPVASLPSEQRKLRLQRRAKRMLKCRERLEHQRS
jgi:hypothetical protein